MICKACKERGKTWKGTDPKCAFENGVFDSDNFRCATMGILRDISNPTWCDGQYASLIPIVDEGRYVVLSWYKQRGRTEGAWVLEDTEIKPLQLCVAEELVASCG